MSQFTFPLTVLAMLGSAIIYGANTDKKTDNVSLAVAEYNDRKISAETVWQMVDLKTQASCELTKTKRITVSTSKLEVDDACASLMPDSPTFSSWQQEDDQTVSLIDDAGIAQTEFVMDDGGRLVSTTGEVGRFILKPLP